MLVSDTLVAYKEQNLLLCGENSDGFIPGEAAAAAILGPPKANRELRVLGLGYGAEPADLSSQLPLRGQGLTDAIQAAMKDAGINSDQIYYRISDANGLQYFFKEAALAISRTIRPVKSEFEVWQIADCIGEVGAASVPAALVNAEAAFRKGYAPGPVVLCHSGSNGPDRAAFVLGP
jgi:3-oxoacyl-[acyl-carrier-protein] synthase-1